MGSYSIADRYTGQEVRFRFDAGVADKLEDWKLWVSTSGELAVSAGALAGFVLLDSVTRISRTEELPRFDVYAAVPGNNEDWWLITSLDDVLAVDIEPTGELYRLGHPVPVRRLLLCVEDADSFAAAVGMHIT